MQKVVEGVIVNYEVFGQGKQWMVFMHGWGETMAAWQAFAENFAKQYKILVFDFPGFGNSSLPQEGWGTYEYHDFTQKLLGSLKIKKAVVLGHSFGGRVAILLAARNPQLVDRLLLVDAAGMEIKPLKVKVLKALRPVLKYLPKSVKQLWTSPDYQSSGKLRATFVKIVNQPLRDELVKINAPTVIVWGERDTQLSLAEARMLKAAIKDSVMRIVWKGTHWPHKHNSEKLLHILQEEGI